MSHECAGDIIRSKIERDGRAEARHRAGDVALLMSRLETHRARLFEQRDGELRYGDGGSVTITLTNAEARAILSRAG